MVQIYGTLASIIPVIVPSGPQLCSVNHELYTREGC